MRNGLDRAGRLMRKVAGSPVENVQSASRAVGFLFGREGDGMSAMGGQHFYYGPRIAR